MRKTPALTPGQEIVLRLDAKQRTRASHTPGPWKCDVTDQGGAGHSAYVAVDDGKNTIARVTCYDMKLEPLPYQANARLIAAAPDLLEALLAMTKPFHSSTEENSAYRMVVAAIAKATGE